MVHFLLYFSLLCCCCCYGNDWLIDDDDDVAINEISNNMKLPIYAVLVGRVSFLHTLIVVFYF